MKFLLFAALLTAFHLSVAGQCNKRVTWYGSKAEMLGDSGQVIDTKQGGIEVEVDSVRITVRIKENAADSLGGKIKSTTCEWKDAYKNGKSVYKTELVTTNNASSEGSFTIEGVDGKITILMDIARMDGKKIKIYVDRYEQRE